MHKEILSDDLLVLCVLKKRILLIFLTKSYGFWYFYWYIFYLT